MVPQVSRSRAIGCELFTLWVTVLLSCKGRNCGLALLVSALKGI